MEMSKVNNLNNAVNSTKISGNLNVTSEVNFPKDKILNAQLLEKKHDGQATLKIGNHTVKARMPQNVFIRPGDSFRLQVIGKENDIWNFKFVSINRSSIFYKISPDIVNSHLLNLKLPIAENSVEIAKALFKYGLELNIENYKSLLPFASAGSKLYLESAAFLKSMNLPVNSNTVKIMYEFLNNNQLLTSIIYSIQAYIANNPSNVNPFIMSVLQTLVANILGKGRQDSDKIKNINEIISKSSKGLISRIDKALSMLKDGPLRSNLEKLSSILKGIGMINSSLQEERAFFNIIPAIINGYPTTVELKIFYYIDKELKSIDRSRFSFELTVNTHKIGPVVISASVVNNNVSSHVKKASIDQEVFISKREILEKMISEAGYNLGNFIVNYIGEVNLDEGVNFIT